MTRLRVFAAAFIASFIACLPLIAAASPAFAQTLVSTTGGVDFAPTVLNIIAVVGTVGLTIAGVVTKFLISFLSAKTGVHNAQLEALLSAKINDGFANAINFATTTAKAWVADPNNKEILTVQFNNFFVSTAVNYMLSHYQETIAHFQLSPEKIADIIRSRIAPYLAEPVPNAGVLQTIGAAPVALPAPTA